MPLGGKEVAGRKKNRENEEARTVNDRSKEFDFSKNLFRVRCYGYSASDDT